MIMSCSFEIFLDRVSRWKRVSADSYLLSLCSDGLHRKGVYITHIVVVLFKKKKKDIFHLYGCRHLQQKISSIIHKELTRDIEVYSECQKLIKPSRLSTFNPPPNTLPFHL